MKRSIIAYFVLIYIFNVNAFLIKAPGVLRSDIFVNTSTALDGRIYIQKQLLLLFADVCDESTDPLVVRLSDTFESDPKNGVFTKPDAIDNLLKLISNKGLLAKGEIYSELNNDHINELKAIYDILISARDFDTFFKVACWARQNVNCGLFVDTIYLAILNRKDTKNIILPPPYEVLPNYFVQKKYIIKASSLFNGGDYNVAEFIQDAGNSYRLDINYTTNYLDDGLEELSYFYEDVDLNSYYYFNKLNMLVYKDLSEKHGEYIYHKKKQILTRYNLERYSKGLSDIEAINWDVNEQSVYDPMLIYSNGEEFRQRSLLSSINISKINLIKEIENNITAVITQMKVAGSTKSEIINYLVEILITGENSYEKQAFHVLNNIDSDTGSNSVLGHYMTTLRDPIYWKLNKKIVHLIDQSLKILPVYDRSELYFPGVEVTNVEVKKLITSFDKYNIDITDSLKNKDIDSKFNVKFQQSRLNHKPFSIKISISSLVTEKALIKLYIGPKVTPAQIIDSKNIFLLLDCFEIALKIGSNSFTRKSDEIKILSVELLSLKTLRKYIEDAEFGIDALPVRSLESQIGFPSRLILPKGASSGLPLQIFVFVAPFVKATVGETRNSKESNYNTLLSPGYPLDLDINIHNIFDLPNAFVKDILIVDKSSISYNSGDKNDTKPNYSEKQYDYKAKLGQYGKREESILNENDKNIDLKLQNQDLEVKKEDNEQFINDGAHVKRVKYDLKHINKDSGKKYFDVASSNDIAIDKDDDSNLKNENELENSNETKLPYQIDNKKRKERVLLTPRKKVTNLFNVLFRPIKVETELMEPVYI